MGKISTDKKKIKELLERGVAEVIERKSLEQRLCSGKQLRVKLGIDPTSPNLHLGRSIPLLKLGDFQKLGHRAVFIVGDFTATIGDTSDKESERPMLTPQQVKSNLKTYLQQASKIIDLAQAEVHHNSEWLGKLNYAEIGEQADQFSLAEFMARENISKRYKSGKRISLREILYPLMQGYDSVRVKADVELGGTDQRFNLLSGRALQQYYKQQPQDLLMNNLIEGTDGRKMSSSWGNTINLTDTAGDMFGRVMSLRDEAIINYFIHCTRVPLEEVKRHESQLKKGANPRDIKLILAASIVAVYFNKSEASKQHRNFINQFSNKMAPDDIQEVRILSPEKTIISVLVKAGLTTSNSEARRKIEEGAVYINDEKVKDFKRSIDSGDIVRLGRKFRRVSFGRTKLK
ncbi:MAG: tyrosine--tRNA ligase [Candidatus Komeilibacteria bacterium]